MNTNNKPFYRNFVMPIFETIARPLSSQQSTSWS